MNKKIFMIMFLIGIVPFATAIATPVNDGGAGSVVATKMAISPALGCERFLEKNTEIEDPVASCKGILDGSIDCEELLLEEGINDAELKCRAIVSSKKTIRVADVLSKKNIVALKNKAVEAKKNIFRERVIAEDKIEALRARYENIKEKLRGYQKAFEEKRKKVLSMKDRIKECRNNNSSECEEFREDAIVAVKEHLKSGLNAGITHLESLKAKIEVSDDISEERVAELVENLDSEIETLKGLLEDVENAEGRDELNSVTRKVAKEWARIKVRAEVHAGVIMSAKTGDYIKRAEYLEDKLECSLDSLDVDVDLDEKVSEFEALVAKAKENHDKADELFVLSKEERIDDVNFAKETLRESRDALQESQKNLRDAHAILSDILKEIRLAGGQIVNCDDDQSEVEDDDTTGDNETSV